MPKLNDRLRGLMERDGISAYGVGKKIGVSHVAVYKWLKGDVLPTVEKIEALADLFHVTPAYLQFGELGVEGRQVLTIDESTVSIPVLDVSASCGGENGLSPDVTLVKMLRVSQEWLSGRMPHWANKSSLHIITANGDSMEPTISNGDFVIIDSSKRQISTDAVYALYYAGTVFLKRVQVHPDGTLLLISDNERYEPMHVTDVSSLNVVGRCVFACNVCEL